MKLILFLTLSICLSFGWEFNKTHLENLTEQQKEILRISYLVGAEKDLGLTLASIAVVETRVGKFDFTNNHICGVHQININYVKAKCKVVESNPYISAKLARDNLMFWLKIRKGDLKKAIRMYNVGYLNHPHQYVYLNRVYKVKKVLQENKELWM